MYLRQYDPVARCEVVRESRAENGKTAPVKAAERLQSFFGAEEVILLASAYFAVFHAQKPDYALLGAVLVLLFCREPF